MIRCINLDSMFIPVSYPEIEFTALTFNGGELHIKLNNLIDYNTIEKVIITTRIKNSDDIMMILLAQDALKLKGIKSFDLVIPYIPYARQDRLCANGESFSLKVFANLINNLKFDKVYVIDSHSDVAPALLDNCINTTNDNYVELALRNINSDNIILVSPDSGANKKINKLYDNLKGYTKGVVKCDKKRDTNTGNLSGFEVFSEDLNGSDCLIVDDICSKGGTFAGIAKELKNKNAGNVYLFVTHYEGVADENILKSAGISQIFKTNSMNDYESNFVKNINIKL